MIQKKLFSISLIAHSAGKGLNLSIPPKKLNYGDFLQPFESFYTSVLRSQTDSLTTQNADLISASIKNASFECLNSYNPKIEQNLSKPEYEALKSLLKDDDIMIQKSDKGNSVVIVNKRDYTAKMNNILNDASKFKKLNLKPGHDYNFLINQEL